MTNKLSRVLRENSTYVFLFLLIIGILAYAPIIPGDTFWDDNDFALENTFVQNFALKEFFTENVIAGANLLSNYWRPFLLTTFAVEWHIWGNWSVGYHLVSILLHIINALLLYYLLKKLFKSPLISLFVSLFFLIHPLQTEAIAYVSSMGDPLSVFFIFLTIIFYLKSKKSKKYFLISSSFFILALLTKETAIILPLLILTLDIFVWLKNKTLSFIEFTKEELRRVVLFLGLTGIYILLRATILNFQNTFNLYGESTLYAESVMVRILTFFKALSLHTQLFFFPTNLHIERSFNYATSLLEPRVIIGFIVFVSFILLAMLGWKKRPEYTFSILWLFSGLSITSGILVPINGLYYEHWMYLPIIGFLLLLSFAVKDLISEVSWLKDLIFIFVIVIFLFFSFLTFQQNEVWKSPISLYNNIIKYNDQSPRVWNNLGMAYAEKKQYSEAREAYQKAISLNNGNSVAASWYNLGNTYRDTGDIREAIKSFEKSLEINEKFIFSYTSLISMYIKEKEDQKAIKVAERGLQVFPNNQQFKEFINLLKK